MASTALMSVAAAIAGGAYVNAKYNISTDLKQISEGKVFGERLGQRLKEAGPNCTLWGMFDRVDESLDFLWFESKTWTYGQIKTEVKRFAGVLAANGVENDDFVAVFTTNSPEMIIAILAISKLGAVAPLINTNLRGETFKHCMDVSNSKMIVSTPDLSPHVFGDIPHFSINLSSFPSGIAETTLLNQPVTYINLADSSQEYPPHTGLAPPKTPSSLAVLIYTSGTTGKPKACGIRNHQLFLTSNPLPQDTSNPKRYYPLRTYSALPLFHGTAIFTGLSYSLGSSATLCLRRKFSAREFFKDVHDSRATRILYIGELCRYLLASAPSPYDKNHQCIVAGGNGLRREIWDAFKTRFNIPEIREFYRSTEGVAKFDNFGTAAWGGGKLGHFGPLKRYMETDTFIVKFDEETQDVVRDPKTGFCVRAAIGEKGEVLGRVKDRALLTEYLGNDRATEQKLLRNVWVKGDLYQRMGDLCAIDSDGWVGFVDRVGDSFRWKGENVSAGEVRDMICEDKTVEDAIVFGVKLASYDGQCGAAVITLKAPSPSAADSYMATLHKTLKKQGLPDYAIPRLVRISGSIAAGVTFKQGKMDEAKKPWDPSLQEEREALLYWLDGKTYRRLDKMGWEGIERGSAKL